ncbi:hypothetical protein OHA21_27035 [Actinoplanes sp. NBC_00393]|uniref:hypothetical protein n=1 Tax=Actinoplanes sp. NBC_00393 TaxID=2975953 RepID=UPI002E22EA67
MPAERRNDRSSGTDASGELRRYTGVFAIFCGIAPLLMFSLLASKPGGPVFPVLPNLIAGPFIILGVVVTTIGIFAQDPTRSAQRVGAGAALIILGDLLIFGVRAAVI